MMEGRMVITSNCTGSYGGIPGCTSALYLVSCHLILVTAVLEAAGCNPCGVSLLVGGTVINCDPEWLQQERRAR